MSHETPLPPTIALPPAIAELREQILHNCAIADARHARNQSLCTYLLNMREYYRWAQGLPLASTLPAAAVGAWIRQQEQHWDQLENEPFRFLICNGDSFDPFDERELNRLLVPLGWAYTAGVGRFGKPHFCLAELKEVEQIGPLLCWKLGKEIARDSSVVPATYREHHIVLRTEAIERLAWEKWSLWRARPQEIEARQRAVALFTTSTGECDLPRLAQAVADLLLYHELGEAEVEAHYPASLWHPLLASAGNRTNELFLRLVRDQFANALALLPFLAHQEEALVHLHFALPEGMERRLIASAYWQYYGRTTTYSHTETFHQGQLLALAESQRRYWQQLLDEIIDYYHHDRETFAAWVTTYRDRLMQRSGATS